MPSVEYDTKGIPTIYMSPVDVEELKQTDYVQVDEKLFVIKTYDDRIVVAKAIPYNAVKEK